MGIRLNPALAKAACFDDFFHCCPPATPHHCS
jgi:hypothetical protein